MAGAPILELPGGLLDPMTLTAVMCYPRDGAKRRRLLASYRATVLAEGGSGETVSIDRSLLRDVIAAPSRATLAKRITQRMKERWLAGELLLYLLAMQVFEIPEPSRRKALFVMDRDTRAVR